MSREAQRKYKQSARVSPEGAIKERKWRKVLNGWSLLSLVIYVTVINISLMTPRTSWGATDPNCHPDEAGGVSCVGPIVGRWRYLVGVSHLLGSGFQSTLQSAVGQSCVNLSPTFSSCSCSPGSPVPFSNPVREGTGGYGEEYGYYEYWGFGELSLQINHYFGTPGITFVLSCSANHTSDNHGTVSRRRDVDCPAGFRPNRVGVPNSYCVGNYIAQSDECSGASGGGWVANPISAVTGNKRQEETDYQSGMLEFTRTYNSTSNMIIVPSRQAQGRIGKQWRHNYDSYLSIPTSTESAGTIRSFHALRPNGSYKHFVLKNGSVVPNLGILDRIEQAYDVNQNAIGWNYITGDGKIELYNKYGNLVSVTNQQGRIKFLDYDGSGRLISVTDDTNRSLTFAYDSSNRIETMTTPDGGVYRYTYDTEGNLATVSYPDDTPTASSDDPLKRYHYESSARPHALTGITDETGNRFATWSYDTSGRAVSSERVNGIEKSTLNYIHIDDPVDPRVTVTNELGKQTTYHYTSFQGVRKITQVEGHQSTNCAAANQSYTYDANGFKDLVTDWEGNVTDYDHDARGLEVQRIEAKGTPQQRVITTQWHADFRLPTKITEPDRVIDFTYDTQGLLLERKETPAP